MGDVKPEVEKHMAEMRSKAELAKHAGHVLEMLCRAINELGGYYEHIAYEEGKFDKVLVEG